MPTYFTVDRLASFQAGLNVDLTRYSDVSPPELQQHVDELFPAGLSAHGERYFLKNRQDRVSDARTELLFEQLRRASFPQRPSRFTSVFAARTLEEAKVFRDRFGLPEDRIWEVEATAGFVANMSLLSGEHHSILIRSYLAFEYWRGNVGPNIGQEPFWEVLLPTPVRVLRQVLT